MSQFSNMLSKINIDQGGVDIPMKKKTVHVSGKEVNYFNKIFDIVDYDEDDKVLESWVLPDSVDRRKGRSSVPAQIGSR